MTERPVLFLCVVTGSAPLEADAINKAMDRLEESGGDVRVVIAP